VKILVTGHAGYIGAVLVPLLLDAGHTVVGLDSFLFEDCTFGPPPVPVEALRLDVRDARVEHVRGFDAIVHLAALSNDPLGALDPAWTYAVNHTATVRLARLARAAGVPRFVLSSSCSLYGAAGGDALLTEEAAFNPVTAYGESKMRAERDVGALADVAFSPTFLRNATAYGVSPRLRCDLVVNNLVGAAVTTGEVFVASDGTPWRPLIHVEDIARAIAAVLDVPRERVHGEAFNVGRTEENYQIGEVARMVAEVVPGSRVRYAAGGGPDPRCYRVDCGKLTRLLPEFRPRWTVRRGIEELWSAYEAHGLTRDDFTTRYVRLAHLRRRRAAERATA
jgi:nucleoside-diphosphate-sugar epimerase